MEAIRLHTLLYMSYTFRNKKNKKRVQQLQSVFENNIFERIVIIVKEDFTCFFCGRLFLQYFAGMNNIN